MTRQAATGPSVARTVAWEERDGMLWSPLLAAQGVVAGFTTRALGSMGGNETPPEEARAARGALATRLGFDDVVRVRQVHGSTVVRADAPFAPWPEADAMWTPYSGVLLGVVAADCVPILVASDEGRVGAAHAGWEGTSRGVARHLVETLAAAGAAPERMVATLGPSIGPCCYAIEAERAGIVRERLGDLAGGTLYARGAGYVFDLWRANAYQLIAAGVREVEMAGICTKSGGYALWSRRGGDIGLLGLGFIGRRP